LYQPSFCFSPLKSQVCICRGHALSAPWGELWPSYPTTHRAFCSSFVSDQGFWCPGYSDRVVELWRATSISAPLGLGVRYHRTPFGALKRALSFLRPSPVIFFRVWLGAVAFRDCDCVRRGGWSPRLRPGGFARAIRG
jgi:hypothetical protein